MSPSNEGEHLARPNADAPKTYDELVSLSPQGSIFAHRWWLEAVAPKNYEIMEVRKGGALYAAWPLST